MPEKTVSRTLTVLPPYPGKTYDRKPYTRLRFEYVDGLGFKHTGDVILADLLKEFGLDLKPGDIVTLTVDVGPGSAEPAPSVVSPS